MLVVFKCLYKFVKCFFDLVFKCFDNLGVLVKIVCILGFLLFKMCNGLVCI